MSLILGHGVLVLENHWIVICVSNYYQFYILWLCFLVTDK